jgi:hypothetical protein
MSERDPELEKLYREHSREEPSSALDARILAAAHRAVDSGPRKAGAEATRPQRWWMPLAAAAAIGVIAIGVVQQMPHETAIDPTWDTPHPSSLPPQGKRDPVTAPAPATPPPASAPAPATQAPPAPAPAPIAQPAAPPPRAQPPAAMMEQRKPGADDGARARKQKEAPAAAPPPPVPAPPTPAAKPAMPQSAPPPPARENKLAAEPVPFPAAPAPAPAEKKTEMTSADTAKRDAPPGQPMMGLRKDSVPRDQSQVGAAMAPRPPPPPAPAAAPAPAPAPAFAGRSRLSSEAAGNVAQSQRLEQEMQTLARDPDAWIARIRKLRDEGNAAQALRELKEFRALVADAEQKLPADLKSLQP